MHVYMSHEMMKTSCCTGTIILAGVIANATADYHCASLSLPLSEDTQVGVTTSRKGWLRWVCNCVLVLLQRLHGDTAEVLYLLYSW